MRYWRLGGGAEQPLLLDLEPPRPPDARNPVELVPAPFPEAAKSRGPSREPAPAHAAADDGAPLCHLLVGGEARQRGGVGTGGQQLEPAGNAT